MENQGASVVITHHILDGKQQEYEKWLNEIVPVTKHSEGFIDLQIVRPIPDLTFVYTVIIRFDTIIYLKNWMESDDRRNMIEKANPLFRKNDNYKIKSGLDFLFESESETKVPVRWKQFLVTWSAIYPLSLLIPLFVLPFLRFLKIPVNHYFDGLINSGFIVFLMVFAVMPNYTKLIRKWLYK
ncbi:antibiotic biosynthesis monooxygenase (ABM) superfamily enzyme [Chryseobacterium ginsenosidimutans]|uniref:antibiotic biosynthesis monooxygenase n=1 Tax=Chryseobacterium ginsenosidimutans TaxID=687846 RepID=UPI002169EE2D|nr:antibiotic biosynthesis monooxygenase [Chryseobacterium ginsenosidimutans]MCS3869556.1 antibiotic biosynthesis monooxygenase (ABM) superfamily enzyme [Chryseobacterium ginsenosidimutans]